MTSDLKDLLYRTLTAIDYSGNRDAFINDFLAIVAVEALDQLSHLLIYDDLQQLKYLLNDPNYNPEHVHLLLGTKISPQIVNQTYSEIAQKDLQGYLNILLPALSPAQKDQLKLILDPLKGRL